MNIDRVHRNGIKNFIKIVLLIFLEIVIPRPAFAQVAGDDFNTYILKAASIIQKNYLDLGYANQAYTHNITYGNDQIKAEKPPQTMCVAAMAELIAIAINEYAKETGDTSVFTYLPARNFTSMSATDLRSYIWVDHRLKSYGTADALILFGMGKRVPFSELKAGSFINLNRTTNQGHAVMFVSFIDIKGTELPAYSKEVAGFKYFSAQGEKLSAGHGAGFGFRYAIFGPVEHCPVLPGKFRDCGIILSSDQKMLNTGYMLNPTKWDKSVRDSNLNVKIQQMYNDAQAKGKNFKGIESYVDRLDFEGKVSVDNVMTLNPAYLHEKTTDDE